MSLKNKRLFAEKIPNPTSDEIPFPHELLQKACERVSLSDKNKDKIFVLDKGTELLSLCEILEEHDFSKQKIEEIVYPHFSNAKASLYECRSYGIDLLSNLQQDIEKNTMINTFGYFIMNPAYNGKHKAEKIGRAHV